MSMDTGCSVEGDFLAPLDVRFSLEVQWSARRLGKIDLPASCLASCRRDPDLRHLYKESLPARQRHCGDCAYRGEGADVCPLSLFVIPRFERVKATPGRCLQKRRPMWGTLMANGTASKTLVKTVGCKHDLITSACYLCNTHRKTRFLGPFGSVLLLCVQGRSVIVTERRRGASRGRPV